jgi:hypothetical protein
MSGQMVVIRHNPDLRPLPAIVGGGRFAFRLLPAGRAAPPSIPL